MRILIDECLDWRLCKALGGHDCSTVQKMGWAGFQNGELLAKAEREFDVFVTGDRNLTSQQQLSKFRIAVIVLHAKSIQLNDTLPLMSQVLTAIPTLQPGEILELTD